MQVANAILSQLGGRRFLVMTGAKNLVGSDDALTMKLPANLTKGRATHLRVTLDASDTYTVETMRAVGTKPVVSLGKESEIYAEDLQACFERMTGLYVRL